MFLEKKMIMWNVNDDDENVHVNDNEKTNVNQKSWKWQTVRMASEMGNVVTTAPYRNIEVSVYGTMQR